MTLPQAIGLTERTLVQDPALALAQIRGLLGTLAPTAPEGGRLHRLSALALRQLGRTDEAEAADLRAMRLSVYEPDTMRAAQALATNQLSAAEPILRARLKAEPTDVASIRMLAELAGRIGRYGDAEKLLRRAVELTPDFHAARSNLATVLHRQNRTAEALAELDLLLTRDGDNIAHFNLKAAALGKIGDYEEACALYEAVLAQLPEQPKVWMSYGHVLKTLGRQADSVAAYRRAIAIRPAMGEAWWSLANLKTVKLDAADVAAMEAALTGSDISAEDRYHLLFALGKAQEDRGEPALSFAHYSRANALRRAEQPYDPGDISRQVARMKAVFTPDFVAAHMGDGCPASDPIFILGMPRAGSTLIEQILSSHSLVEGTMELPDIPALAVETSRAGGDYPDALRAMTAQDFAALGAEYLERTRIQRKSDKPLFIDKLPNNWLHTAFIATILPNAKIIDARRHPLDCCLSNFRQHFARGQAFSYDMADMGHYYADYVEAMAWFDHILPGRVVRVIHEQLVEDSETQIRALLDAISLPFEEPCLRFWENDRAVRTASSEQVRRPINRDGMGQWRTYEAWIDPLKAALGDVLHAYPDIPARHQQM